VNLLLISYQRAVRPDHHYRHRCGQPSCWCCGWILPQGSWTQFPRDQIAVDVDLEACCHPSSHSLPCSTHCVSFDLFAATRSSDPSYSESTFSFLTLLAIPAVGASCAFTLHLETVLRMRCLKWALRLCRCAARCGYCGCRFRRGIPRRNSGADLDKVVFA